jgi:threonine/homoserine/homoserine lactone efflux protein
MAMDVLSQLWILAGVVFLACVSPGPDFIAVTSFALGGRRGGLGVALGVAVACLVWATLAMAGLGLVLTRISWLYEAIRLAGAAYLIWLGYKMLRGALQPDTATEISAVAAGFWAGVRRGLAVSATNPKAAAFFGSVFVSVLPADTTLPTYSAALAIVGAIGWAWFSTVALLFSNRRIRTLYARGRRGLDAVMGAVLVALGARLAVTQ